MAFDPKNCQCGHTKSHHVMNPRTRKIDGMCYAGMYRGSTTPPCGCPKYIPASSDPSVLGSTADV